MRLVSEISLGGLAGLDKNMAEARRWVEKAAGAGDPDSQFTLYSLLATSGDEAEREEAGHWLERIFEADDPACFHLIDKSFKEKGMTATFKKGSESVLESEPGFVEAVRWFRRGAELGSWYFQAELAEMYENGYGLSVDYA